MRGSLVFSINTFQNSMVTGSSCLILAGSGNAIIPQRYVEVDVARELVASKSDGRLVAANQIAQRPA
jgi:hypothetical protein